MKILKIAAGVYVIGALVFLMKANLDLWGDAWDTFYFVWAKGKDVLFFLAILYLLKPEQKWIIKPLLFYASINLLWELIRPLTNLDVNHPLMVTMIFTALIIGVIVYLIRDLRMLKRKEL